MLTKEIKSVNNVSTTEEYFELLVGNAVGFPEKSQEMYKVFSKKNKADFWDYVTDNYYEDKEDLEQLLERVAEDFDFEEFEN